MKETIVLKPYKTTSFEKSISKVGIDNSIPFLPLIHKVDGIPQVGKSKQTSLEYFEREEIFPVPCDVFGEDLIYTFIGRPAYREVSIPVCFIIEPAPELIQNIVIFDSGAYYENRYKKIVDNKLDVNLFRIPATQEMIKKFIALNFGENIYYYFGLSKIPKHFDVMKSEEEFDYEMLKRIMDFGKVHFDVRCRTIENILRTPIDLKKYLMALIMPNSLSDNEMFKKFCKSINKDIDIIYYDDQKVNGDDKLCNRMMDKVLFNYYLEKGYIVL